MSIYRYMWIVWQFPAISAKSFLTFQSLWKAKKQLFSCRSQTWIWIQTMGPSNQTTRQFPESFNSDCQILSINSSSWLAAYQFYSMPFSRANDEWIFHDFHLSIFLSLLICWDTKHSTRYKSTYECVAQSADAYASPFTVPWLVGI